MSFYATFKTYNDLLDYIQAAEYPKCFTVNYKPDTDEYALWIGNQPYYVYEGWIEELEQKVKELKKGNKELTEENEKLKAFITGWEYDLTPEFRKEFPNGF